MRVPSLGRRDSLEKEMGLEFEGPMGRREESWHPFLEMCDYNILFQIWTSEIAMKLQQSSV